MGNRWVGVEFFDTLIHSWLSCFTALTSNPLLPLPLDQSFQTVLLPVIAFFVHFNYFLKKRHVGAWFFLFHHLWLIFLRFKCMRLFIYILSLHEAHVW